MTTVPALNGNALGNLSGDFVIAEWEDEGGLFDPPRFIAPWHVHHEDDEAWYVLQGALCVQVGSEVYLVPAGSGILGPKGVPHTYWNPGPEPARYLLIMRPNTMRLIEGLHQLPDRTPERLRAHFAAHGCELLGTP